MKIYHSINDCQPNHKTVVTLGTFDGVHVGHRKIIEKLIQSAHATNRESLILTFFPHPRMILQERSEIELLNTIDEKIELLENTGLDHLIIHPFDEAFSRLTAEEFVSQVLVERFNIGKIIIGHDHRFGRNRTANIDDLIEYGAAFGFEVEQISAQEIDAVSISSTKIRKALNQGHVELANQYLGYNYQISGTVVRGQQLGRTIGYPTANIGEIENYKLIPKIGIYIVRSEIDGVIVYGMMSIGTNPTVGGDSITVEVYYLDFNRDLYGRQLTVHILHFLRDEKHFDSVALLKAAIDQDLQQTRAFLLAEL